MHVNSVLMCYPVLPERSPLRPFRMRSALLSDRSQPQWLSCRCWRRLVSNQTDFLTDVWYLHVNDAELKLWALTPPLQVHLTSWSTQTKTWWFLKSGKSLGLRSSTNQRRCVYAPSPPPSTRWTAWWRTRGLIQFKSLNRGPPPPPHELYIAPAADRKQ